MTSPRRFVVSGATGLLGSRVVSALQARGEDVVGTSRSGSEGTTHLDLTAGVEPASVLLDRLQPSVVVHLAAAGVNSDRSRLAELAAVNVFGTAVLLEASVKCGVRRFVHVSSEVAGEPDDTYGVTKRLAEILVVHMNATQPIQALNLRLPVVFGLGEPQWKLVPSMLIAALKGEELHLETPDRVRGFLYADDAVDAVLWGIDHAEPGQTVQIPSAGHCTVQELAELTRDAVSGTNTVFDPGPDSALHGWRPSTSLRDALAMTAARYTGDHRSGDS